MGLNFKKKVDKQTNIASSPEQAPEKKEFSKAKFYYLLWYIVSLSFHLGYVVYLILTIAEKTFLSKAITYLLYGYGVVFLIIVLVSLKDKKRLKDRIKNYKSALNFLKYLIQLISFTVSIVNAISSFFVLGKFDRTALGTAMISLILTLIMIVLEVTKIIIRKNIPIFKRNFLRIKEKEEIKKEKKRARKNQLEEDKQAFKFLKKNKYFSGNLKDYLASGTDNYNSENGYDNDDLNENDGYGTDEEDETETNTNEDTNTIYDINKELEWDKKKNGLFDNLLSMFKGNQSNKLASSGDSSKADSDNRGECEEDDTKKDFPVLEKNQEYDESSGVIYDYEDDEEEEDDEDDYYGDGTSGNGKKSKFSFFKKTKR